MQAYPASSVNVSVLDSGEMVLKSTITQLEKRFEPHATAMWMALCQCDGKIEAAASMLSGVWNEELAGLHAEMLEQVDDWRCGGFMEVAY
jgi:hypothetical protein